MELKKLKNSRTRKPKIAEIIKVILLINVFQCRLNLIIKVVKYYLTAVSINYTLKYKEHFLLFSRPRNIC